MGWGGGGIRPYGRERKPASMCASAAAMSVGGRSALGSWGGSGSGKRRLFVMGVVGDEGGGMVWVGGGGGGWGCIFWRRKKKKKKKKKKIARAVACRGCVYVFWRKRKRNRRGKRKGKRKKKKGKNCFVSE